MNDLISVIMPCYNSEKYIQRSIESVLNQTYKNIELIIVNDGSVDNTLKICNEKFQIDNRIVIIDIPNGGVAKARNIGVKNAKGKYIMFIDSDDMYSNLMIEKMYNTMIDEKVDVVKCMYSLSNNKNITEKIKYGKYETKEIRNLLLKNILKEETKCYLWTLLIKKEYIVKFNEKFFIYEDLIFYLNLIMKINSIFILNENLYIYNLDNMNSLTKSNFNKNIYNMLDANIEIEKILELNNINNVEYKRMFNTRIFTNIINYIFFIQYNNGFKDSISEYIKLKKNKRFIGIKKMYSYKYASLEENILNYSMKIYFVFFLLCMIKNQKLKNGGKK